MTTDTTPHEPSRACYLRGCESPACQQENYRYTKQLTLEHSRGQRRLRDASQVRTHIERLLANNWWQAEIARAARVPRSDVSQILAGQRHTNRRIALAILSIPVTPIQRTQCGERTDATGSTRRIRALAILGHPNKDIGALTGMTEDRLTTIARGIVNVVRPDEARKIAGAYRALSVRPGRMKQIATAARNKGWDGPLSWDNIDDPQAKPESNGPRTNGYSRRAPVDATEVTRLTHAGLSAAQIALQLRCDKRTVVRARRRAEMAVAA